MTNHEKSPMNTRLFLIAALILLSAGPYLSACPGNEYWAADPPNAPVWTSRQALDVQNSESKINDILLRSALTKSGLAPCPDTEKDLVDANVRLAVRTMASPIRKQKGFRNYDEVTQIMIRYYRKDPKNPQAGGVLEVMSRTKVRFKQTGTGKFFPAHLEFEGNATQIAKNVAANLNAMLAR